MITRLSVIGCMLLGSAALASFGCSSSASDGSGTGGTGGSTGPGAGGSGTGGGTNAGGSSGTGGAATGGSGGSSAGGSAGQGGQAHGGTAGQGGGAGGVSAGGSAGTGGAATGGAGAGGAAAGGTSAGQGGSGGSSAGAGGSSAGTGGSGGSAGGTSVAPILCPETDSIHPKNANTVVITDPLLSADTHWTADKTYLISVPEGFGGGLDVSGHTLTIDAGTVICLDLGNHLSVGSQGPGEIHVNGTSDKPVIVTAMPSSQDPTKPAGFHAGISFDAFQASTVSNLAVFYGGLGGGGGGWALRVEDTAHGTDPSTPLQLDHLTLDQIQVRGIYVGTPKGISPTSTIHLAGFAPFDSSGPALDAVAQLDFMAVKSVAGSLTVDLPNVPADAAHIDLRTAAATVDGAAELFDLGLAYRYHDNLTVGGPGASLTLHEGVTLGLDAVVTIGDFGADQKGELIVLGTAAKPVNLTSSAATPAAADWGGIFFVDGEFTPTISKIDHANILYAGFPTPTDISVSYCSNPTTGAVMISGPTGGGSFGGPVISNTTIAHSLVDGIVAGANPGGSHFTVDYSTMNITFQDIAGMQIQTADCP